MTAFGSKSTPKCYTIRARGKEVSFDHPITIGDMKKFAREQGINSYHAYLDGRELDEREFPVSGSIELREYSAPKA